MSGFAEYLHTLGFKVSGSDSHKSKITDHLVDLGIEVFLARDQQISPRILMW